jgi:hypothetical protein
MYNDNNINIIMHIIHLHEHNNIINFNAHDAIKWV